MAAHVEAAVEILVANHVVAVVVVAAVVVAAAAVETRLAAEAKKNCTPDCSNLVEDCHIHRVHYNVPFVHQKLQYLRKSEHFGL